MRTRFCVMAAFCLLPTLLPGQDAAPGEDDKEITVPQWVERLESKKFSIRNEATRQLQRMGLSVIDQLEAIALEGGTESANRAFEVLKRHHAGEDPTLQVAAAEVLKRIAETQGHPKAGAAAEILDPPSEPARRKVPMQIPMAIPGNLQIQIQGRIGGNALGGNVQTRVQVRITNGKKDITVEENGKKLRVLENDKGIRVEKTDAGGQTETKQYKDLEELKAKDPEAAKKFENNGRGLNIQIGANPLGGGQPPGLDANIRKRLDELRKQQQQRIDQLRQEQEKRREEALQRIEESRKRLRDSPPDAPPLPRPEPENEEIKENEKIQSKSIKVIEV